MQIGFIGLGNLGAILVRNLVDKEYKLHLYNRTKEKLEVYSKEATLHDSLPSIAQACDIILSIVSDDKAVQSISLGKEGLVENMKPGTVHICLSTISPSASVSLNQVYKEKRD
jgi:3-hydroxyisobutyrate dehydrogenase-like beta-hydroxyacid dehydrogenase